MIVNLCLETDVTLLLSYLLILKETKNPNTTSQQNHEGALQTEDDVFKGGGTQEHKTPVEETVTEDLENEVLDYVHTHEWKAQKKHIFILSEAGKPIYSR